jgi:hypothetical protein
MVDGDVWFVVDKSASNAIIEVFSRAGNVTVTRRANLGSLIALEYDCYLICFRVSLWTGGAGD